MEPKNLTKRTNVSLIKEICRIIETASNNGVKKLEYGELRLEFFENSSTAARQTVHDVVDIKNPSTVEPPSQLDTVAAHTVDPDLLEDIRRSQMMIDDPAMFEHEIVQQHLRQGAVNEDEDRGTEYPL